MVDVPEAERDPNYFADVDSNYSSGDESMDEEPAVPVEPAAEEEPPAAQEDPPEEFTAQPINAHLNWSVQV